jgi:hypothetical protein
MNAPVCQDKLEKELQGGLTPKNDMKMRIHITDFENFSLCSKCAIPIII